MLFVLVQITQNDVASLKAVVWASSRKLTSNDLANLVSAGRDVMSAIATRRTASQTGNKPVGTTTTSV